MSNNINLTKDALNKIERVKLTPKIKDTGTIISLSDGVAWLEGMRTAMYGEIIKFDEGIFGLVLNLEDSRIGAIIFGDYEKLQVGDTAETTDQLLTIGVSDQILGRVVDPMGNPLDENGDYSKEEFMSVDKIAPGIVNRHPVYESLQ